MTDDAKPSLENLKILAVDDEPDVLETIADVLDGATVHPAADFASALNMLSEDTYDLAVLDIMGVNGLELLTEAVNRNIPTIMLTAHGMNRDTLKESITKGALAYLPKEELAHLDEYIVEFLSRLKSGGSTWEHIFDRLGSFFEKAFGPNWVAEDPNFWRIYYPYF